MGHLVFIPANRSSGIQAHIWSCCGVEAWKKHWARFLEEEIEQLCFYWCIFKFSWHWCNSWWRDKWHSAMCPTWEVSLWHSPPEGAEQGTCLISWAGTECVMPSVLNCSLAFNNSLTNFEWENFLLAITKGLVCSTASAGLSLRGTVRSADWCAFSKCFPAKLALINKIYEGKEKLVLPSWGFSFFFCTYD